MLGIITHDEALNIYFLSLCVFSKFTLVCIFQLSAQSDQAHQYPKRFVWLWLKRMASFSSSLKNMDFLACIINVFLTI